ncbi:MAG: hypothetical protein Q4G58_09720 [bacterium]|nr:hypothetical protein [bacterium]
MSDNSNQQIQSKKSKTVPILLTILIITMIAVGGIVFWKLNQPKKIDTIGSLQVEPNLVTNVDDLEDLLKKQRELEEKSQLAVNMPTQFVFKNAKSEGAINVVNAEENAPVSFSLQVTVKETGNVAFKTGLIPPGTTKKTAKLETPLEKGTHPATVLYTTYDSDGTFIGQVGVEVDIIVQG